MSVSCLGATEPIEGPLVADCDLWCLSLDTLLPRISVADSPLMILSELSVPVVVMKQEEVQDIRDQCVAYMNDVDTLCVWKLKVHDVNTRNIKNDDKPLPLTLSLRAGLDG